VSDHPSRVTDHLLKKMWQTKSARFNGHARLIRRHWLSIAATSLLACYLVALSLFQIVFEESISRAGLKLISVTSIVVSVFLIMITLYESARDYRGEAERLNKNALAISELYNEFQGLSLTEADAQRPTFVRSYSHLMKDAELGHADIDLYRFRIPNARELAIPAGHYCAMLARTSLLLVAEYWTYAAMIIVPPVLFYLLVPHILTEGPTLSRVAGKPDTAISGEVLRTNGPRP
jgi:hypothetical protein